MPPKDPPNAATKICQKCKLELPLIRFSKLGRMLYANYVPVYYKTCVDCRRKINEYYASRTRTLEQCIRMRLKYHVERCGWYDTEVNTLTTKEVLQKLEKTGGVCIYCGKYVGERHLVMDHTIPMVHGGANSIDNITFCCAFCNKSKGTKTLAEFMEYRARTA